MIQYTPLKFGLNNMLKSCSEIANAKRVNMINVGISNVEVETIDGMITSVFSREHNRVDKLIE